MDGMEGLEQALDSLNRTLPNVPAQLEALVQEASQTRASVEEFLASLDARLTEAGELIPRLESQLRGLARLTADETLRLDQDRDLGAVLNDPSLGFEDKLKQLIGGLAERRASEARGALEGWGASQEERGQQHEAAYTGAQARFDLGHERVAKASATTAEGLQGLQRMVEITRTALTEEVERFGAALEAQQAAAARDVDELRKDLEGFEAAVVTRVERVREAVRADANEMVDTTRDRLEELRAMAERAVKELTKALEELDNKLKAAEDDAEETREALVGEFESLHERLGPLRHALESVREAAHSVGVPL